MSRKTLLRPTDIAWQAYQAGFVLCAMVATGQIKPGDSSTNAEFRKWWDEHPQTLKSGELRAERKRRK